MKGGGLYNVQDTEEARRQNRQLDEYGININTISPEGKFVDGPPPPGPFILTTVGMAPTLDCLKGDGHGPRLFAYGGSKEGIKKLLCAMVDAMWDNPQNYVFRDGSVAPTAPKPG